MACRTIPGMETNVRMYPMSTRQIIAFGVAVAAAAAVQAVSVAQVLSALI